MAHLKAFRVKLQAGKTVREILIYVNERRLNINMLVSGFNSNKEKSANDTTG
jgi:hypothetical protein